MYYSKCIPLVDAFVKLKMCGFEFDLSFGGNQVVFYQDPFILPINVFDIIEKVCNHNGESYFTETLVYSKPIAFYRIRGLLLERLVEKDSAKRYNKIDGEDSYDVDCNVVALIHSLKNFLN